MLTVSKKRGARTSSANWARRKCYLATIRSALPLIREARSWGLANAEEVAWYLNYQQLAAPRGGQWSIYAVQRALRKLKSIGAEDVYRSPREGAGRTTTTTARPSTPPS
jgi:hypothetical protein